MSVPFSPANSMKPAVVGELWLFIGAGRRAAARPLATSCAKCTSCRVRTNNTYRTKEGALPRSTDSKCFFGLSSFLVIQSFSACKTLQHPSSSLAQTTYEQRRTICVPTIPTDPRPSLRSVTSPDSALWGLEWTFCSLDLSIGACCRG